MQISIRLARRKVYCGLKLSDEKCSPFMEINLNKKCFMIYMFGRIARNNNLVSYRNVIDTVKRPFAYPRLVMFAGKASTCFIFNFFDFA